MKHKVRQHHVESVLKDEAEGWKATWGRFLKGKRQFGPRRFQNSARLVQDFSLFTRRENPSVSSFLLEKVSLSAQNLREPYGWTSD